MSPIVRQLGRGLLIAWPDFTSPQLGTTAPRSFARPYFRKQFDSPIVARLSPIVSAAGTRPPDRVAGFHFPAVGDNCSTIVRQSFSGPISGGLYWFGASPADLFSPGSAKTFSRGDFRPTLRIAFNRPTAHFSFNLSRFVVPVFSLVGRFRGGWKCPESPPNPPCEPAWFFLNLNAVAEGTEPFAMGAIWQSANSRRTFVALGLSPHGAGKGRETLHLVSLPAPLSGVDG